MPSNAAEWDTIATKFNDMWNFPNCIGALDGKHIVMIAPPNSGSVYYNYKHTHSIVLMGIADAEYKLIYVDVGCNGRIADGGVFNKCSFAEKLENGELSLPPRKPLPNRNVPVPYVLVADDAFALRTNVMKPHGGNFLSLPKRVFNYRLSRTRRIIENVFGIMSARFRVLRSPINLDAAKTRKVTLACCVLHNFLMTKNASMYATAFDRTTSDGLLIDGDWRADTEGTNMIPLEEDAEPQRYIASNIEAIRTELQEYFVGEGELEWQLRYV